MLMCELWHAVSWLTMSIYLHQFAPDHPVGVSLHTGVGHTDNESAQQFDSGKSLTNCSCAPDGVRTLDLKYDLMCVFAGVLCKSSSKGSNCYTVHPKCRHTGALEPPVHPLYLLRGNWCLCVYLKKTNMVVRLSAPSKNVCITGDSVHTCPLTYLHI